MNTIQWIGAVLVSALVACGYAAEALDDGLPAFLFGFCMCLLGLWLYH